MARFVLKVGGRFFVGSSADTRCQHFAEDVTVEVKSKVDAKYLRSLKGAEEILGERGVDPHIPDSPNPKPRKKSRK